MTPRPETSPAVWVQFIPLIIVTLPFLALTCVLARRKGRSVPVAFMLGCIPIINIAVAIWFASLAERQQRESPADAVPFDLEADHGGSRPVDIAQANPKLYGGFWRRFGAWILDWIVFLMGIWGPLLLLIPTLHLHGRPDPARGLRDFFGLRDPFDWTVYFSALFLYWALSESSGWRGTVGKRAFGLIVTDYAWHRISFGRALARNLLKWLSSVLFIWYIMAAFTQKKQALHDKLAGCVVIRQKRLQEALRDSRRQSPQGILQS